MDRPPCSLSGSQETFFSRIDSPLPILSLVDHLPATYFFVKDASGFFVFANRALMSLLGIDNKEALAGKNDHDFFDASIADRYRDQDHQVMASGEPLVDHVCVVPDSMGILRWYVETKIPLFDREGVPLGVAGILHDLKKAGAALAPFQRLDRAMSYISERYADRISVEMLANMVNLSVSQFNRTFKRLFKISPAQYVSRVRIYEAGTMLRATSDSVEQIAARTGFCDASHFVRQFKKTMDTTPRQYREKWKTSVANDKAKSLAQMRQSDTK
jgi:AraC-like DNA-binding protein